MTTRIQIGDVFKPKPTTEWYQGKTLRVYNIRFTDKEESEHRVDVRISDGSVDSFWRERFLDEYEKLISDD